MKKIFTVMMMVFLTVFTISCSSCHQENDGENDTLTYNVTGVDVEKAIMLDNEYMTVNFKDYRWLECCIDSKDWIDSSDVFDIASVTNIFSVVTFAPDSMSGDMDIYLITHTVDSTIYDSIPSSLWLGDEPMNKFNPMGIDFAHAYDAMMRANCVKPHSRHCVLRKESGQIEKEPLYIFGNQDVQAYVSSVDGSVSSYNPVYPVPNRPDERFGYAFNW